MTSSHKGHAPFSFELKALSADGVFNGYGSVYGNIDEGDDIMMPGCFADSLADYKSKGRMPAMLWQHEVSQPIGKYTTVREDSKGLYVEGQLALKTQKGAEAYELMRMKAISGLSVGYIVRDDEFNSVSGIRKIKRADLFEISPVTFPMNDAARVGDVKSIASIETMDDMREFLQHKGLPKSQADYLIESVLALRRKGQLGADEAQAFSDLMTAARKLPNLLH